MTDDELLIVLQQLEISLHQERMRRDPACMDRLLHPQFEEFGRSGRRYTRREIIGELAASKDRPPMVVSGSYRLTRIGEDSALLTYVSAHLDGAGRGRRQTLRSSLWMLSAKGWQMRFHQGTPVDDAPAAS